MSLFTRHSTLQKKTILWEREKTRGVLAKTIMEGTVASGYLRTLEIHGEELDQRSPDPWSRPFPSAYWLPLYTLLLGFSVIHWVVLSKIVYMVRKIIAKLFPGLWNKVTGSRKICPWNTGPNQRLESSQLKLFCSNVIFSSRRCIGQSKREKIQPPLLKEWTHE